MIAQVRESAGGTVLVVDSGDTLFGNTPADMEQAPLLVAAMNAMQYDALALGELDLGAPLAELQARLQEASFAVLSANVGPAGTLQLQPYLLRQVEGHTVALVGATSPTAQQRSGTLGVALAVEDPVQAVQRTVDGLQGQADVIVVLSNLSQELNHRLATEVAGLDAILGVYGGDIYQAQAVQGPAGMVVLQAPGREGQAVGVLNLYLDTAGQVVNYGGEIRLLTPEYENDPGMVELLQKYGVQP